MKAAPFHQFPGDPLPAPRAFWAQADDGVRLRMALWGDVDAARGTILLMPGRTEYIEKYAPVAALLTAAGHAVLCIDWRGQGLSDRLQESTRPGHIVEFSDYQRDVVEMVLAATDLNLPKPWHLLAHSMGGCIGLAAIHNDLPVSSVVFSAPMWGIVLHGMPQAMAMGMANVAGRLGRGGRATLGTGGDGTYVLDFPFGRNLLTGDAGEWCRMVAEAAAWPDLTIGGPSWNWLARALTECRRLAALPSPDLPMMVSLGEKEGVVSTAAIRDRAARWPGAELMEMPNVRHEVMMEKTELRQQFLNAALSHFAKAG